MATNALHPFWVTFHKGHGAACVEAASREEAILRARELTGCEVLTCGPLPYPAEPRISPEKGSCPSFCWRPASCAGLNACPRQYACSE